jgi:AraC family transcriptional regulator, activator of mtrCDE
MLLSGEAVIEDSVSPLHLREGMIVLHPLPQSLTLRSCTRKTGKIDRTELLPSFWQTTNQYHQSSKSPVLALCGRILTTELPQCIVRDNLPTRLVFSYLTEETRQSAGLDALPVPGNDCPSRLERLLKLMRKELLAGQTGFNAALNHVVGAAMSLVIPGIVENDRLDAAVVASMGKLAPAVKAMLENPHHPWTLPELARLCSISRATFIRQFNNLAGRSPKDFLLDVRIANAARDLSNGADSVELIGKAAEYQSSAAIQKRFKCRTGMTTSQWRRQSDVGSVGIECLKI